MAIKFNGQSIGSTEVVLSFKKFCIKVKENIVLETILL